MSSLITRGLGLSATSSGMSGQILDVELQNSDPIIVSEQTISAVELEESDFDVEIIPKETIIALENEPTTVTIIEITTE